MGINNDGVISGTFRIGGSGGIPRGFLRSADGAYTAIDVPGVGTEYVNGINNLGRVVGYFPDPGQLRSVGFVRNPDGAFATIQPLGARDTYPMAINDTGQITGYYFDASHHGFVAAPVAGGNEPVIRAARGVMSASAFGGFDSIASGTWIEIYGQNFSTTTRQWRLSDFSGDTAPLSLDGVSVRIDGRPAFVSYISPGQINIQAPAGLSPGTMAPVTVVSSGRTSIPYSITVKNVQPGLLSISSLNGTVRYVAALFPDNVTYVLPPSPNVPVPSRRARAGDTVTFYGIGFGPVEPDVPPGQVARGLSVLSNFALLSDIRFNLVPAKITYAGLSPGSVGLYQFNVEVPDGVLAPGQMFDDGVRVIFRFGDVLLTQTLYTAIER
jgi:uncharacterized protein (TIGR03437 family)